MASTGHSRTASLRPGHWLAPRWLPVATRRRATGSSLLLGAAADPPRPGARAAMQSWNGGQLHTFLNHVATDRLSGAWWLLATTGMRRGEVLGLRWSDVEPRRGVPAHHTPVDHDGCAAQGLPGPCVGDAQDEKGRRAVALDPASVAALRQHRTRQLEERIALGANYADEDLVVCKLDGTPLHPKNLSYKFGRAAKPAGRPQIRLHDLRPSHATLALRAGIHPRVVQERLGHANVSITLDTYSHVDLAMQTAAAKLVAALVTGTES